MPEHTKVSAEDQALLNKFARSYQTQTQLKADVKEAKTLIDNINEASDEILLLDDEDSASIPCRIGSCFVHFNGDSLNEHLEGKKTTAEKVLSEKTSELDAISADMEQIKKVLYAKFGDQINLDAEE
ncbi:putative prefoldin subunit 4 [Caenorhabditis elegans]|uniref:Probable prefoldin subunit 4 n=1 Tax=Caenorhabditis elegans TaxID=6239 RepID=PFD4_CAEEL|nr:putative prefoldin subunit 4 [Caenorhabditis elegans]Q17435.1 RecName: Full=Probable prefoldin subunit 4 [Caenorhabditis elegans]AAG41147.1 4M79 [Caenorhabditis elegans]CAA97410.1 Probable prefoldin subunit 4 [Caenorhabditis elegans]|eukprot:NP_502128.1 Probable prefoldin subunit 4 [Caenorhabditis elegans]